jgi:hypothetical protein
MSDNARNYVQRQLNPITLGDQVWQVLTGQDDLELTQSLTAGARYE